MTTNKPEVIAYRCSDPEDPDIGHWLDDDAWNVPFALNEPLIRLFDHERLQAETERLQADHEADKARIAELEQYMKYARTVMSVTAQSESISRVCHRSLTDEIARIDAALAQQGKDGEG